MIKNGTNAFLHGLQVQPNESREGKWLYLILQALYNVNGTISSSSSNLNLGTTPSQSSLGASDTLTIPAGTVKGISFQVLTGTLTVTIGSGSPVLYSAGSNINFSGSLIAPAFSFSMSSGGSDKAYVQTMA